ncbi:MAG: type III-B CRISPR module RAMP protein Cmr1 [Kofleriaceae bacterium]
MRSPPKAPPAVAFSTAAASVQETRGYRFLTPVFGGGVTPQAFDPVTPVRVASIRGQLRFWWRAVNPRGCETVEALRAAEAEVFGSTKAASALVVRVSRDPGPPTPVPVLRDGDRFRTEAGMEAVAYGAFPLRAEEKPFCHGKVWDFGARTFELTYSFPERVTRDVHAALWAWAHVGGLGGRTRRGFGAIAQLSPRLPSLEEGWKDFVAAKQVPWPHLVERPTVGKASSAGDGRDALTRLLGALRKLRQGEGVGRRRGQGSVPGRSYWPEPDAIRRRFPEQVGEKHRTPVTDDDCFPRAHFGAPIIFHFKDQGIDPRDSTLRPKNHHRLASRLILRPHQDAKEPVAAMALVLAHPEPCGGYVLVQGDTEFDVAISLSRPLALGDPSLLTDPIQRFLEELNK